MLEQLICIKNDAKKADKAFELSKDKETIAEYDKVNNKDSFSR